MKNNFLIVPVLLFYSFSVFGQEWIVPSASQDKLSPFAFTDSTRNAGEQLYANNCRSCHGTPGQGNVLNLVPPPQDPAKAEFQQNKDGEIFYKVSEGRGPMPSFKNVLSSQDIWNIISFLRTFNPAYIQKTMEVITSAVYPGAEIRIRLSHRQDDSTIVLSAQAFKDNIAVPVKDAGVRLFVYRTFGMIPLDEEKTTDKDGLAVFKIPAYFPGDTAGNINVSARFTNEDVFGTVTKDTLIHAGETVYPVSLVANRAFWNTVWKSPRWLIITYFGGLLLVWGIILYVLLMLRDIFVIGKAVTGDSSMLK